jgi:hypothetical protein
MGVKIEDTPIDASLTGVELIPLSDASTAKHTTATLMKQFVIDKIEALAAAGSVAAGQALYMLQSGLMSPVDIDVVLQRAIDTMWGKAAEASPDDADVMVLKDGGVTEKTIVLSVLAEYVRTIIEPKILDFSDLTDNPTPVGSDMLALTTGTTGQKVTFTVLSTAILALFNAYVTALAAVTVAADADVFYVIQGGVQKKVTKAVLFVGIGDTIAPATTTENNIPQWSSAQKTLVDGLTVQATIRADGVAVDTAAVTEKAVRTMEKALVFDQTDIGAALVDADAIIVDDGNAGTTQRKSTFTRVWTWIGVKFAALTAKTVPTSADIVAIQDSADSGAFKNLTMANLNSYLRSVTQDRYVLTWLAGQRGKPGLNADILDASEAVRMVTNPEFQVFGTNAVSAGVTINPDGGIIMTTAGADGDEMILMPHLDANQSGWAQTTWGTGRSVRWECRIKTGASITNCIIWAGLKLTQVETTATDDNQVFIRFEDDVESGNFQAVASIGGSDIETDSGVTAAIDTDYNLIIEIKNDRTALFYINDVLVYTSTPLTDATNLIPYIGVAADGAAAAKTLNIRSQAIRRDFA